MRFKFPLASVLRFRESTEKREELALQKAQLEVARVCRYIDNLTARITDVLNARDQVLQKPSPAHHLQNLQAEMDAAVEAKQSLSETLRTLNNRRDEQMKLYQAARAKRQMLSNLLAQHLSAWEQDQLRTEQKQLDDIFAARSQRS